MPHPENPLSHVHNPEVIGNTRLFLFDLYDTAVDLNGTIKKGITGLDATIDGVLFARRWREQYSQLLDAFQDGKIPWLDLDTLMRRGLEEVLPEFNLADAPSETKDKLIDAWYHPEPWPDTKNALERLRKKGYTMATMSNATLTMQREIAKTIGIDFDYYFSSDAVEAYKQNIRMFQQAFGQGFGTHEITMVANWLGDLKTAASANIGFNTAYVYRSKDPSEADFEADIAARDLTELADVFGA